MLLAEHRERNIMAHRRGLLDAVLCHREDHGLHVLVAVAEDLIETVTHLLRVRRDLPVRDLQILDVEEVPVEPLTVRLTCRIGLLALLVRDDALCLRVDEQHTARLKTGLLHDVLRVDVEDADLGGQDQSVVVGDVVSGRTEAVTIEGRADHITIREEDRRRTIPRLHHGCVIMIEILLVLVHEAVVLPWLRDGHHHRERQVDAVHVEELEGIVKHRGIRSAALHDREDLLHVLLEQRARHGLLAGQHSVNVSTDGIDLTVMGDHAVRMRTIPARRGVRRETGVHDGDGGPVIRITQVIIEGTELLYQEHALIYDGSGAQRTDIGIL